MYSSPSFYHLQNSESIDTKFASCPKFRKRCCDFFIFLFFNFIKNSIYPKLYSFSQHVRFILRHNQKHSNEIKKLAYLGLFELSFYSKYFTFRTWHNHFHTWSNISNFTKTYHVICICHKVINKRAWWNHLVGTWHGQRLLLLQVWAAKLSIEYENGEEFAFVFVLLSQYS